MNGSFSVRSSMNIPYFNLKLEIFKNTILGEKQLNYLDFFSSLWLIRVLFVSEKADIDCGRKLKQDDFLAGGFMFTCFYLYLVKIPILTNDFSHGLKPTTSLHWAQQLFPDDGEIVKGLLLTSNISKKMFDGYSTIWSNCSDLTWPHLKR